MQFYNAKKNNETMKMSPNCQKQANGSARKFSATR